jgi:hypothetical protein
MECVRWIPPPPRYRNLVWLLYSFLTLGLAFRRQPILSRDWGMRRTRSYRGERQRAAAKARWADPIAGAKWRAALYNPTSRAKIGEATKARWADPVARERLIAAMRAAKRRNRATADC